MTAIPKFWSDNPDAESFEFTTIDEVMANLMESVLPECWPETVTLYGFSPVAIKGSARDGTVEAVLNAAYEYLDDICEFGDPNGSAQEIPKLVRETAKLFVKILLDHYSVWRCKQVCQRQINMKAWLDEHAITQTKDIWYAEEDKT
jgi:hypothetical protein